MRLLTLIIILLNVLRSQGVLAETLEIVSTNSPVYSVNTKLSNHVELKGGEWLYFKVKSNGKFYQILGPFRSNKIKEEVKKIVAPDPGIRTWEQKIKQVLREFIPGFLGGKMLAKSIFKEPPHKAHPAMGELWTLTPWDKNFCYSAKEGFSVKYTWSFEGEQVLLTWATEAHQVSEKEQEGIPLVILHQLPNKTWDSKTYQAVWMAEKGCYRQAELLLRVPPNEKIPQK